MTASEQTQATEAPVRESHDRSLADATLLRPAGILLVAGQLLYILITQFHPGGDANDHESIFATYASDDRWKAVHVGQFVAMGLVVAGLLVLYAALKVALDRTAWAARVGAAAAIVALALYGVLQALDGVANQEADKAWVGASDAEEPGRFAAAEALRWLEWGVRSYHDYTLGLALLLLAAALLARVGVPRGIGYLMGSSGVAHLVQGWVVGADGFSTTHTTLILLAWALSLAWMVWLVAFASGQHRRASV